MSLHSEFIILTEPEGEIILLDSEFWLLDSDF